MKKFLKDNYAYIFIFLIFLIIGLFVPTGGDDWEISSWYNKEGLFSLFCKSVYSWNNFNGRIIHNFFTMVMGKYSILWAFTSATVHVLTIYYLLKIFKLEKNKLLQFLLLILFLMVPYGFRMEVQLHKIGNTPYSWGSLITFYIIYLIQINMNLDKIDSKIIYIVAFLLGLIGSLWIENITIALFSVSILMLIINYIKTKKINKYCLFVIFGCVTGCLILFTSPGFSNRYNSSTGDLSTIELIKNNIPIVLNSITLELRSIYFLYSGLSLAAFLKLKPKKDLLIKIYFLILSLIMLISIMLEGFGGYSILAANMHNKFNSIFISTNSIISILLMISILLSIPIVIIKLFNKQNKEKALILYFLSLVSVAPMVLSPGNRNYILCFYSLFIIIANVLSLLNINKLEKDKKNILLVILCILFLFRLETYHYILARAYSVSTMRNELIKEYKLNQIKNKDFDDYLILPTYDKEIMWNFNSEAYIPSLINYYDLRSDSKVVFDDHFMYQGITIVERNRKKAEYEINVEVLSSEVISYNIKIYNQVNSQIVFEETKEESSFITKLEKGSYTINCTMINNRNEYQVKNESTIIE